MNSNTERDIFVHISTPADFNNNLPTWHNSHATTDTTGRQWGRGEGGDGPPDQLDNPAVSYPPADTANFQTVSRVLDVLKEGKMDVLKEGKMDVAGFLDALCWGNKPAIVDPTAKYARTGLMHSNRLATVVSRWLSPPRTSPGGPRAEGARHTLLPLVISTVKEIINNEMSAVVKELKEESADVTEQSVLGTVIEEVQGKVRNTAPVFYDLVKTAAWSKEQEEQNTLKDPTKVSALHQSGSQQLIQTYL